MPQRYRVFLWMVYHGRIMTNEVRFSFGLTSNSYCPLCNDVVETCLHVLTDCKLAKDVWMSVLDPCMVTQFFQGSLHDWIKDNLSTTIKNVVTSGWERCFALVIWWL